MRKDRSFDAKRKIAVQTERCFAYVEIAVEGVRRENTVQTVKGICCGGTAIIKREMEILRSV